MKLKRILAALLLSFTWVFAVQAVTTTFQGVTVSYENASTNWVGGELVLTYTSTSVNGTLSLDCPVVADVLVVGGGGGGGGGSGSSYYGNGGAGGAVVEKKDQLIQAGSLTMRVGGGGAGSNGTGTSNYGGDGLPSSISGTSLSSPITADGGAGGQCRQSNSAKKSGTGASGSGSAGKVSEITGNIYGAGGKAGDGTTAGNETGNTGNGGKGGRNSSDSTSRKGGNGADGIVIVRLKEAHRVLTIQRGETVSAFNLQGSDDATSFDSADVTDVKFSPAEIAECGETSDGKVGIVGKLAGTTEVTIVTADQSYKFRVMVAKLLSGLYRAGAYEVAVTNASDVFYVDGDLVIAYRDADGDTAKSFTLPRSTAVRLLAVGGGGAGGTYKTPYAKSGALPGGGGAGRMIEKSDYELAAQEYVVEVGKGGAAATVNTSDAKGADGGDTTVAGLTAKGGGGGGVKSAGRPGGSGGGGSASSSGVGNGGSATAVSTGDYGYAGGQSPSGNLHGAGGGGAGGAGGGSKTKSAETVSSAWGVGGKGRTNDITGVEIEYARGGDGAWFPPSGLTHTGKPGLDGRGDGGSGGSCSGYKEKSESGYVTTFGGRGGNGVVIVRIPAYKMLTEDALVAAFAGQPATVSGTAVTLTGDVAGPIRIPDNLGAVTIDLAGHSIIGANGADGDDITAGGDGASALEIVPHEYESVVNAPTVVKVTGSGSLTGGNGGTGHPAGLGAEACAGEASHFNVGSVSCVKGTDGVFIEQHPHEWAYRLEDGKIVATCVAPGECSYKTREPFIAVKAEDANYTSMRYDGLNAVNGITPATGIVVAPEVYVGRDGTGYPASVTPPTEQGHYSAIMSFDGMSITSDFSIVELPFARTNVYSSAKTAERLGRDVRIALSASFDGAMAINNSDVLFIGSCCQAHSMTAGTIEKTVNALAKYANVRWYAHNGIVTHASDPDYDGYVLKGGTIGRSISLEDGNHCIYTKMMEDLWNELVLNEDQRTYGLIVLEFDGNLLGRIQGDAYQFVFDLPEGWDDDRVAILQAKMKRFYDANKVVWVVPSGNGSDGTATGGCPWTSQPECLWQRALFNTTEDAGFECPLQHDYENADKLTAYLKRVIVGHFFSNVEMKDKLAEGLSFKTVTPQMRNADGIWCDFNPGGTEGHYTIYEPRSGTTVTADVVTDGREVTVSFDMREEQAWASENNVMLGDEYRVVIDAEVDGIFFSGVAEGAEKSTNEGPAIFTFTEPNLQGEGDYSIVLSNDTPKVKNILLTPEYSAEDVVKTYDGLGTNIVVTPIQPSPEDAVVRYSLDEHGPYADTLSLTEVCDKTKVWFEITDGNGDFTAVTNFACVTILPGALPKQTVTSSPYVGTYDGAGHGIAVSPDGGAVTYLVDGAWVDDAPLYTNRVEATNVVFRVTKAGHADFEGTNTVTVTHRNATLTSGTKTDFVYDGTPHAFTNLTATGFVSGEGLATTSAWATVVNVAEGQVANTFAYTLKPNTLADNYEITVLNGKVAVVPAPVIPKNPAGDSPAENPGEEPGAGDGVVLWAENVVKMYDGLGTNVIAQVYNAVAGNGFAIEYSVDGTAWTSELAFTNVVESQKVYFRALPQGTDPNYVGATGFAYVTVTNRPVTITFAAADKVYDGTDAATCTSTNFENLVAGEGFALGVSAMSFAFDSAAAGVGKTVAATGYADALLTPLGGTLASNYAFTFVDTTTAAITLASLSVSSADVTECYDGTTHRLASYVVTDPRTGEAVTPLAVSNSADGVTWYPREDFPLYVDVTNAAPVHVAVVAENYGPFVSSGPLATVTVTQRIVTVTLNGTNRTYGAATPAWTVEAVDGLVGTDVLSGVPGAIVGPEPTDVSGSPHDVMVGVGSLTAGGNYTVVVSPAKLTVDPAPVVPAAAGVDVEYDGLPHSAEFSFAPSATPVAGDLFATNYFTAPVGTAADSPDWISCGTENWAQADVTNMSVKAEVASLSGNFLPTNAVADIVIWPRTIADGVMGRSSVRADDKSMTYGETPPMPTWCGGAGLVEGHFPDVRLSYTNDPVYAVGTYPDAVVTNALIAVTNAAGADVTFDYQVSFVPGTLTVTKDRGYVKPIADMTYDGTAWTPALTVTNAAGAALAKGTDYTVSYHDNVHATNLAHAVVEFAGNYGGVVTNYFAILPRPVTLKSGSETFTYDGNGHSNVEVTVSSGSFVAGEGVTTNGFTEVRDVCSNIANAFAYDFLDGTLAADYEIAVVTGKVAVVPAPVIPKNPAGDSPAENPGDEPGADEGVVLWAENVVKVYDGIGTNVLPQVYNAVEGNDFMLEYSTNETDWASELAFTNVTVGAQKVYFRALPKGDVPNYLPTNGYAFVTITNRPVTITFAAADKVYDATTAATCTSTNFANVVTGEGFALDTSAMSFAFDTPDVGSGKTVTATGYDDALLTPLGGTLASNYSFTFVETAIAAITHAKQTVVSTPYSGVYDGEGHTITVDPDGGSVTYLVDGGWVDAAPLYTNRVEATNVVFRVTREGYETFEDTNTVTVSAKAVTLESGSRTFPYDGVPHAFTNLTATGFVAGEGLSTTSDWAAVTAVAEGEVPNAFAYTLRPNTLAGNYEVTVVDGKLAVVPAPVVPRKPSGPAEDPGDRPMSTDGPTLWAENVIKMYDGVGTNVLPRVYNAVGGNDFAYEYSVDELTWTLELAFTNVTGIAQKVYFRAIPQGDVPNYLPTNGYAFVTITNRPVTIAFAAADKVYDGTPAATCTATNFENLVAGENLVLDTSSMTFAFDTPAVGSGKTVTATGYDDSLVVPLGGTLASNYAFTFVETTTAAITHAKQTVVSTPYSGDYDGEGHTITVDPDGGSVTYLVDGSWVDAAPLYTNRVEATNVVFRVTRDGYETFEGTNTVTVSAKAVTLESGSRTFTYDGAPHAYTNLTATGFVAGEGLSSTSDWATVTSVAEGEVDNTFSYTLKPNTLADNYVITVVEGKVAVAPVPVLPKNPSSPAANPGDVPTAADGVVLWAENVVKMYDGLDTNIIANVYNAVGDNAFTYEYSTNGVDFVAWDALQFTSVVTEQKVWYRAMDDQGNYLDVTNFAFVTITNRPVTVAANDTNMVFGADVPVPTWRGGRGLVPGHFLDVRLSYTNDPNYAVGVYPDAIVTNALIAVTNAAGADVTSNYLVSFVPGTLTVEAKSVSPDPANPTKPADPDMDIAPIDPLIYDGEPKEPEVAVTNGVTELIRDVDYTVVYGNNTNATEEAYAVVTGIGNYEGCFTNYFTILPREVTLMSGTKTMYLDPAHPGEPVVCSNALVLVVSGSFVTNAATGVKDGFVATDMTVLESATPIGPVDNEFTAEVSPGLATNYLLTCEYGQLAILDTPVESHGEIHEEVPTQDGEGVIDVVMDNRDAGKYAADKPPELNELEELVEKGPLDDVEVRLLVSSNYLENSFCEVTNEVVNDARGKGKSDKEIKNYSYDALDIAVNETHWHYEHYDDIEPTSVVTRDIGNEIDSDHMLTITIPYAFNPKLIEFSVWRNHTNDSNGVTHEGVVELTQSAVPIPGTETWTTNEASVILRVHKFSVYVFKTLVLTAPQLTGSMHWKYHRAHSVFYGGLDVVCTNGDNRTISNLSYVYEDRDDCYLRSITGGDRLSKTSAVTYGGKKFGLVRLDDVAVALREGALNVTSRCGVAETTFTDPSWKDRYVVPTLAERRIALATTSIEKLANGDPSVVDSTLGYLTWQEEGYDTVYWCALAEGLEPLPVDSLSGGTVPLTLAMANKAKAYGLPPLTPDSDPALVLEAFKVEDGVVRGRVAMREDDVRGVPGSNARLTVLGAAALTDAFVEVAWPQLSKDGSFSFRPPEEIRYFRARLTVRDVIR